MTDLQAAISSVLSEECRVPEDDLTRSRPTDDRERYSRQLDVTAVSKTARGMKARACSANFPNELAITGPCEEPRRR